MLFLLACLAFVALCLTGSHWLEHHASDRAAGIVATVVGWTVGLAVVGSTGAMLAVAFSSAAHIAL